MTQDIRILEAAAKRLRDAAAAHEPCAPVRDLIGTDDFAAAYAVQALNVARRLDAGARRVGRKIGMTSVAVQRQLGYDQPNHGMLFADREIANGACAPGDSLMQPRAEAEIAFVLGRDLDGAEASVQDAIRAIDCVVCAIEIIDSRIAGWDIRASDSIADNASGGMFVLGNRPRRISDVDLALCGMVARRNGQIASLGVGAACLGNPLLALVWLTHALVASNHALKAGDVILTGALGPMVPLSPGDFFEAEIDGLGSARVAWRK